MSYLDHAKREAKRLLKVAQTSPSQTILINNLADAQKTIAFVNGYPNWHDYAEVLRKKDLKKDIFLPDEISEKYFPQELKEQYFHDYLSVPLREIQTFSEPAKNFSLDIKNKGWSIKMGVNSK